MDPNRIVLALQASLDPEQRENAEKLLFEMYKIAGFAPTLLQIVLEQSLDLPVRQAGAVFLKNMIAKSWKAEEPRSPNDVIPFQIHENDKNSIRNVIVPAIASSIIPIQSILQIGLYIILKCDFPNRFPNFTDQLMGYLNSLNSREFHGALLCLHSLVKVYDHNGYAQGPLPQIMCPLLPLLHHRFGVLIPDTSNESLILQKLILKIFYNYSDFHLPTSSINEEWIAQWHLLICSLLEDFKTENDDPDSDFWKRQKWAARILHRWFTSYGSPGNVPKKYASFADWYLKSFSNQVLNAFLQVCDAYRRQKFVSPVVLSYTLAYFSAALSHAFCWKILRPYFDTLLQEIIVPLLSFTEELAELWEGSPLEYIRCNTSMYLSMTSPSSSAASLIKDACTKRSGVLDRTMQYCTQVLNHDVKPEIKDGALHLIGTVCRILLKNKVYKEHLENFMTAHVLSLFEAPEGYRRARACWLVKKFSRVQFSDVNILCQIAMVCRHLMSSDPDLPVRVAAAITIFSLIKNQAEVKKVMSAHLAELVMQLLKLLRETELDDLNNVLRKVQTYANELQSVSIEMLQHLSGTFVKLVGVQENGEGLVSSGDNKNNDEFNFDEEKEYQTLVATGVIQNIESLVTMMEGDADLLASTECVIVHLVQVILKNEISDFYDEAFSLVCTLTCTRISPLLWTVYDWLYHAFSAGASDCFDFMAPALHNYLTVDPKTFIDSPDRVKMFIEMCKQILLGEEEQAIEGVHAAKLLEVFALNFRGRLDGFIGEVIELAVTLLTQESVHIYLRIRCLLIVIAAIITSTATVLPILCGHMWPNTQTPIIENFLKMWIDNISEFSGLHDQRVCVLGLCALLSLSADQRPPAVDAIAAQYLPSLLHVLTNLKNAYAIKKEMDKEEDSDADDDDIDDDESSDCGEAFDSDTDVIDEEGSRYLDLLEAVETEIRDSDDDDDDEDYEIDSVIESYDTELDKDENEMDEYVTFYQLMTHLEIGDAAWYQRLVSSLSDSQKAEFKEIAKTAVNCMAQKESKRIEKAGGYNFQQTDVPSSFNFSGGPSPQS